VSRKIGKFDLADAGTLFMHEIGVMALGMQSKLIRVLEEDKPEPFQRQWKQGGKNYGNSKDLPIPSDIQISSPGDLIIRVAAMRFSIPHNSLHVSSSH
jgi:sigma54-dependent transcription regulator